MRRVTAPLALCLLLLTLLGGLVASPESAAAQGNNEAAKLCQKDGWNDWQRTDGTAFANQGECVSYAAQGNTLVPRKTAVLSFVATSTEGVCLPVLTVSGYEQRTHVVVFGRVGVDIGYASFFEVDANGDGSVVGSQYYDLIPEGTSLIVYVDGMPEATGTAAC